MDKIDINDIDLREIAKGIIRFSIKADDTPENQEVHNDFKEFCRIETDNNYTQGLKRLLENYSGDTKFDILYQEIQILKDEVNRLKENKIEKKEEHISMFGEE